MRVFKLGDIGKHGLAGKALHSSVKTLSFYLSARTIHVKLLRSIPPKWTLVPKLQ